MMDFFEVRYVYTIWFVLYCNYALHIIFYLLSLAIMFSETPLWWSATPGWGSHLLERARRWVLGQKKDQATCRRCWWSRFSSHQLGGLAITSRNWLKAVESPFSIFWSNKYWRSFEHIIHIGLLWMKPLKSLTCRLSRDYARPKQCPCWKVVWLMHLSSSSFRCSRTNWQTCRSGHPIHIGSTNPYRLGEVTPKAPKNRLVSLPMEPSMETQRSNWLHRMECLHIWPQFQVWLHQYSTFISWYGAVSAAPIFVKNILLVGHKGSETNWGENGVSGTQQDRRLATAHRHLAKSPVMNRTKLLG